MGRLDGKTCLITAAGQGIGRATALAMKAEGATVFASDINDAALAELADLGFQTLKLDVTDPASITAALDASGGVDVLFNCAGFVANGSILECDEDQWAFSNSLNVTAMYRINRAFLPAMIKRGAGSIINMSSVASSVIAATNRFVYGTTKAAVIGMTKAIAPVSEKFGVPMVEAEGASRSLFTQGYKYLFAVLSTSEQYLASAVHMAAEERKKNFKSPSEVRVALAFEGDPFSMDVRAGVIDNINEYGMQIVIDDQLPADLSDMSTTLTKVKALKPDILIISGHSKGAATAARQIEEMKVNVPMIAMTHCEAAKVQEKFPNAATGFLCPTQWVETLAKSDSVFGSAMDWNEGFKKEYPSYSSVPYQSAQASAAVYVWKEGFEAANSLDKDAVRDAISALEMTTFYGDIKFSEAGNNIAKPMFMRQISADGTYALVETFKDVSFPRNVTY